MQAGWGGYANESIGKWCDEWAAIGPYHKMFQDFERPDREALPDGRPVPIIRYDSEINRAEIVFSDGSRNIEEIVEHINHPSSDKLCLRAVNQ